ncbi:SDR family NAD(P)-dependent oxidoreductase [Pseudoalteromonas sp. T1lg23B]|uniref:SDR family NAD(P)-dependent oxidoreductase n=1 Tax=Pseudoalteromonas sp. T1lg23B TaxID=2077097 RepID=UPI000CF5E82E|nr:SDR family oxidoreductase [Pseudoalteromonas sp. T1lg23B]
MTRKKYALITGSAGGIGKALRDKYLENDYLVIGLDYQEQVDGENFFPVQVDLAKLVRDKAYLNSILHQIKKISNTQGISVLINNAAIQIVKPFDELEFDDWSLSFDVNLHAPFIFAKSFATELGLNNGSIVNISSIHSKLTKKNFLAYSTTKAALSALTRNLAIELGGAVRVNAIEPAAISTEMLKDGFKGKEDLFSELESYHPLGRIGTPDEVADLALFLSSEKANFLHGSCVSINGGIASCLSDPD